VAVLTGRNAGLARPSVRLSVCLSFCPARAAYKRQKGVKKAKNAANVPGTGATGVSMFNSKGQGKDHRTSKTSTERVASRVYLQPADRTLAGRLTCVERHRPLHTRRNAVDAYDPRQLEGRPHTCCADISASLLLIFHI